MQTDANNNSSEFAERLTLGLRDLNTYLTKIYPVPASDYLVVENLAHTGMMEWEMYNSIGSLVLQGNFNAEAGQRIDMRELASGYYFLKIITEDNTHIMKCMKD